METNRQRRGSSALLVLLAAGLCAFHMTAGTGQSRGSSASVPPPPHAGRRDASSVWPRQTSHSDYPGSGTLGDESRLPAKLKEESTSPSGPLLSSRSRRSSRSSRSRRSSRSSRSSTPTLMSGRAHGAGLATEEPAAPVCAYQVIEGGVGGQLCFRPTHFGFQCRKGDCRVVRSGSGGLVANVLSNGSVLLQWTLEGHVKPEQVMVDRDTETGPAGGEDWLHTPPGGTDRRRRGFRLSCFWNGSYTQFECAGVHLGSGCRDFLLSELHENVPYRICLSSLSRPGPAKPANQEGCVEFTVSPSGMQDIVIAMTTVGGAICVMLVIICLLVAYITENIMSPSSQHSYPYHTHSRH